MEEETANPSYQADQGLGAIEAGDGNTTVRLGGTAVDPLLAELRQLRQALTEAQRENTELLKVIAKNTSPKTSTREGLGGMHP